MQLDLTPLVGCPFPICGPDVTNKLNATFSALVKQFFARGWLSQIIHCRDPLYTFAVWDIGGLVNTKDNYTPRGVPCGTGPCDECVEVQGRRVWRWDVNYMLLGCVAAMCGYLLQHALDMGSRGKIGKEWEWPGARYWVVEGYQRCPVGRTISPGNPYDVIRDWDNYFYGPIVRVWPTPRSIGFPKGPGSPGRIDYSARCLPCASTATPGPFSYYMGPDHWLEG